jgi:TetR/AcrR family transcriptional regulator, cholesterol catabolism regulator
MAEVSQLSAAKERAILAAAAELFGDHGYDRATLADVARRVGIKRGSLYYYINSKEDLLYWLHKKLIDELIEHTDAALADAGTAEERLRAVVRVSMRLIAERRQEVKVFLEERHVLDSQRWADVVAQRDAFQQKVEDVLAAGMREGILKENPVRLTANGILGMCFWGYQWFRPNRLSWEQVADLFSDILLDGLKTRDER